MTWEQVAFFFFATLTILAALGMVGVASVFHAALLMIVAFIGIAALYMVMGAGFLGVIQILVYVGAIAVLMLFALMLTPRVMQQDDRSRYTAQWPVAALLAAAFVVLLATQLLDTPWSLATVGPVLPGEFRDYAAELGLAFMNPDGYLLPFYVAAVLLLVALVGAIVIAREEP
ncbi:MAG: NADH-quinone oxidoreductase subunit J [Chloroflexota bacterium]|nr:NADH-quinone oxidoreductase subunit J [Chloroflexota bacterium]